MNNNKLIESFENVIQSIKIISEQSSKEKFSNEFLEIINDEIKILNIQEMVSNYEFNNYLKNNYFDNFFNKFYHFQNNKEHILYKLDNIYELKHFHENEIIKYFDDEFGKFNGISFVYVFSQLVEKIREKNTQFDEYFLKLESKWWIYYMKYTGKYEKLKKIIIQRILNDNILVEDYRNVKLHNYHLFLAYLKKYSIENSRIAKLLFITLNDSKNKNEWFNLFSYLDIKDFKIYNKIVDFTKEKILEILDKLLNLNKEIKTPSKDLYLVLTNLKIGYLFFKKKVMLEEISSQNLDINVSFFIYIFYLLKYNDQEKKMLKFVKDFSLFIMHNIDLEKEIDIDNLQEQIIDNMDDQKYSKKSLEVENIFNTLNFCFPSLSISESIYNKVASNKNRREDAINYINFNFDNDVNEFLKRYPKLDYYESNLKSVFQYDENIFSLEKGYILDFITIFQALKENGDLSIEENDGLLSHFVTRFERIFEDKYIVIKTNYSLLNKKAIINDINTFLDGEYKFKNINEVHDDIWKTFIEYDLLSFNDIKIWSKYEEMGDKLYAIIINKLIVKGNLREAYDKSIYESSTFQNKISKKLNIQKHLIKSGILWKTNFKNGDYLEYLLFALYKNYSYEIAESLLINLLKSEGEFNEIKEREIDSIIRVPLSCINNNRDEYYERPYYQSFVFHIKLIESISIFYLMDLEQRNMKFPYWSQISEDNEKEIFELLTVFFKESFDYFDEYLKNKFKKDK